MNTIEKDLEKNPIDCWSPSERKAKHFFEETKAVVFYPLLQLLLFLKISPNMVSFLSATLGLSATVYMWIDLRISVFMLILSLVLDGVDGSLARMTKKNSTSGSLTDAFADQITISSTTIGFIALGFVDIVSGSIYLLSYPIIILFSIIRNALNFPQKYVFRPRILVYLAFALFVYTDINILNITVLVFGVILLTQIFIDFLFLKNKIQ